MYQARIDCVLLFALLVRFLAMFFLLLSPLIPSTVNFLFIQHATSKAMQVIPVRRDTIIHGIGVAPSSQQASNC